MVDELRDKAILEYEKQRRELRKGYYTIFGRQYSILDGIGYALFVVAILPPFFALLILVGQHEVTQVGNYTIEQTVTSVTMDTINHYFAIAGGVSAGLAVMAVIIWVVNAYIMYRIRKDFIKKFIDEHIIQK